MTDIADSSIYRRMGRILLALTFCVLPGLAQAVEDMRGCYDEREALELLAKWSMHNPHVGFGGHSDGIPEWWVAADGAWFLVMVTDDQGTRCIVDHGPRSYNEVPPTPARDLLDLVEENPRLIQ